MNPTPTDHEVHDHDLGLAHDLSTMVQRRKALKLFAGAGLVALVGCGSSKGGSGSATTEGSSATTAGSAGTTAASATTAGSAATTTTASAATTTATTAVASTATPSSAVTDANVSSAIPEETAGPYPGDGSNGKNVLRQSGVVRSDIRPSLSGGAVATGVPFTMRLQIVQVGTGAPVAGAAVYLWQCDINGAYSMYSQSVVNETYLRGVQETDASGLATFVSIFPGCYDGRWPHVHYEVYPALAKATSSANKIATSQLALPEATCKLVYATTGYSQSVSNVGRVSLATDNVFRDGADRETPTVTGSVANGFVATLVVPVKA